MDVKEYIASGVLESYVLGAASENEICELLDLKKQYPELNCALYDLDIDMERIAAQMAIAPPPHLWSKIENSINELTVTLRNENLPSRELGKKNFAGYNSKSGNQYINVEAESTHMRIHKSWRWVLAAVFVLGKIFLGCAIYFYLENRQAQQQILDLKTELQHHNNR